MNHPRIITIFVIFSLILVGAFSILASSAMASEASFMKVFPITGKPTNIVVESNGRTWFALPENNAIGSLVVTSTVDYKFTQYTIPTANSEPYDLVYDAKGAIWFTARQGNKIGRLNITTKAIEEFTIPTANSRPTGITLDAAGNVWFAEQAASKLGKFDPVTETFTEYTYEFNDAPATDVEPEDVIFQPNGCGGYGSGSACIWSTSPGTNRVYFLNLNTLTFDSIPTYVLGVGEVNEPWHGTVDAQGVLWITTRDGNRLGRYAPGTLSYWRWYQVPTANSGLTGITFSVKDGIWHFWFTENVSGRVGQLLLNPATLRTIRMLDMPVPAAAAPAQAKPYGIATDSAGSVWIADNGGQRIVQWVEPYYHLLQLPIVQR